MEVKDFLKNKNNPNREWVITNIKNKHHREIFFDLLKEIGSNSNKKNYFLNGYNDFIIYRHLMKNNNIEMEDYFKITDDTNIPLLKKFEKFNDDVQKTIIKNKAQKLKHRIISNKYEKLCNNETNALFLEMAQMEFSKQELQDFVGKKIAAFKHPVELNGALMNLIDLKAGWSQEDLLKKIENGNLEKGNDYDLEILDNNKVLIDIKSFKASSLLGSKMWCIAREEEMFFTYLEDSCDEYQFLFDFNKDPSEDNSLVAILNTFGGQIVDIYSKSDKTYEKTSDFYKEKQDSIEKTNKEKFNINDIFKLYLEKKQAVYNAFDFDEYEKEYDPDFSMPPPDDPYDIYLLRNDTFNDLLKISDDFLTMELTKDFLKTLKKNEQNIILEKYGEGKKVYEIDYFQNTLKSGRCIPEIMRNKDEGLINHYIETIKNDKLAVNTLFNYSLDTNDKEALELAIKLKSDLNDNNYISNDIILKMIRDEDFEKQIKDLNIKIVFENRNDLFESELFRRLFKMNNFETTPDRYENRFKLGQKYLGKKFNIDNRHHFFYKPVDFFYGNDDNLEKIELFCNAFELNLNNKNDAKKAFDVFVNSLPSIRSFYTDENIKAIKSEVFKSNIVDAMFEENKGFLKEYYKPYSVCPIPEYEQNQSFTTKIRNNVIKDMIKKDIHHKVLDSNYLEDVYNSIIRNYKNEETILRKETLKEAVSIIYKETIDLSNKIKDPKIKIFIKESLNTKNRPKI